MVTNSPTEPGLLPLMMQGKKTSLTSDSLEIKATQWDSRKSTTSKIPVFHIEPITVTEYLILHVLLCRKQCTLSPEGQREMRTSVSPIQAQWDDSHPGKSTCLNALLS